MPVLRTMLANCSAHQPALGAQGELEVLAAGDGRLADPPGRHLHVLLVQDIDDVVDRKIPRLELVWIEPDPHAVVALAEDRQIANALQLGDAVLELDRGVVAHVELVVVGPARSESSSENRFTHSKMSGDCFLAVTPMFFTASGSMGWAMATRFCTSTWAILMSVPRAKVTSREYEPSLLLCDDMYIIPSTPTTCCSIGAATVSASTRASAPGS